MAWGRRLGEAQYEDSPRGSPSKLGGLLQGGSRQQHILVNCKVLASKLSSPFLPAPASLLWNYPPALSSEMHPQ